MTTAPRPANGLGTAALVLAVMGLVLFWLPFVGLVLAASGLVLAVLGRRRARRGEASNGGVALAALVCAGLGVVGGLVVTVYIVSHQEAFSQYSTCEKAASTQEQRDACRSRLSRDLRP